MRFGSLFAGIGGFDLGLERAGMQCAWQVEIDPKCRQVLRKHWPDAVLKEDVRTVGAADLSPVDLITFGFPCQDLSVAGKQAGLGGSRSGLFYKAMEVVDEIQPAWALFENVRGLLSSDGGRDLARCLLRLGKSGYFGCCRVLDSQWFGVAQRRRRVFGLFSRLDSGAERCAEILSLAESLQGHPPPRREAGTRVAALTSSGVGTCGADDNQAQAGHILPISFNGKASAGSGSMGECVDLAPTMRSGMPLHVAFGGNNTSGPIEIATTLNACKSASGRMDFESETFLTQDMQVRRLTPTECLRLQGFRDDWLSGLGLSDSAKYKMIGNAVTEDVAEWIGRRLYEQETKP